MEKKVSKQNVGNAGEYYVAARLSALDFIATLTLGRTEKYDILALSPRGKLIKLSVKATQVENAKEFTLSAKDENGRSKDFYYAFVRLNKFRREPDFWIIPSGVVCPLLRKSDQIWMRTPGRKNQKHKPSSVRILPVEVREGQRRYYPENWNEEVKQYYKNLSQLL